MQRKRVFAAVTALLLLCVLLPSTALGEEEKSSYSIGSFSYSLPSSWVVKEDGLQHWHYANADGTFGNGYVYAAEEDLGQAADTSQKLATQTISDVITGMTESGSQFTLISRFDVEMKGYYASLLRLDFLSEGETYKASCVLILNGKDIFSLFYMDAFNTPDDQLKIFSEIVSSIEVQDT